MLAEQLIEIWIHLKNDPSNQVFQFYIQRKKYFLSCVQMDILNKIRMNPIRLKKFPLFLEVLSSAIVIALADCFM